MRTAAHTYRTNMQLRWLRIYTQYVLQSRPAEQQQQSTCCEHLAALPPVCTLAVSGRLAHRSTSCGTAVPHRSQRAWQTRHRLATARSATPQTTP